MKTIPQSKPEQEAEQKVAGAADSARAVGTGMGEPQIITLQRTVGWKEEWRVAAGKKLPAKERLEFAKDYRASVMAFKEADLDEATFGQVGVADVIGSRCEPMTKFDLVLAKKRFKTGRASVPEAVRKQVHLVLKNGKYRGKLK